MHSTINNLTPIAITRPDTLLNQIFARAYVAAIHIDFNPAWANETGYMNYAVQGEHAPVLAEGEIRRSLDSNIRRMLIIGTRLGNVVVFDRFAEQTNTYVFNAPQALREVGILPTSGSLDADTMVTFVGDIGYDNVGLRLKNFLATVAALPAVE